MTNKLIRLDEVIEAVGLSRSTIYLKMNKGTFPKPVSVGERGKRWLLRDVEDWIDGRVAERDEASA